ncbi:VWA domain-containing protein [Candidatus Kuenenbacteria bacterium]|nr:VWA domain-containing protein [Candidatus Kuenenbacteria bacterium]
MRREARKSDSAKATSDKQDAGQPKPGQSPEGPQGQKGIGPQGGNQPDQTGGDGGSESSSQPAGGQGQKPQAPNPAKQAGQSKAIVNTATLAQLLASGDPTAQFKTAEGIKTAAEIAAELAQNSGQKFDLQSLDGSFQAKVRGGKSIVEAEPEVTKQIAQLEQPSSELGKATSGGMLGGKGDNLPEFNGNVSLDIPNELIKMMPLLRGLSGEKRIELMTKWTKVPARNRVRGGIEYQLLKGMAHLSALKAISQFEEVSDGEQTLSKAGEQVDILRGPIFDAPLDELKTIEEATMNGGIVDDMAEVRQKKVTTDAPHLVFVVDTSGSMRGERMMAAMAASQATASYYSPRGSTFGLVAFSNNPTLVVPTPEHDVDVVIDGILMLEAGGGTTYSVGLELAIRSALPNTTIMIFGDFEDGSFCAPEVYAIAEEKKIKVIGIVSADGNPAYAAELCDETYTVGSWQDPTAVALVALKAAA